MKKYIKILLKYWAAAVVIAFLGFVAAPTQISVNYTDVPLTVVLTSIAQQSKMDVAYSGTYVDLNSKVSVSFANTNVDNVLQATLKNTTVDYILKNKKIYIFPKNVCQDTSQLNKNTAIQIKIK